MNLAKIIASFSVVWFHTGVLLFGFRPSGVLIFAFISGYFIAVSKSNNLSKKVTRLAIPFIFWSCIYASINLYLSGNIFKDGLNMITGPTIHLWYLPFVIIFSVILFYFKRVRHCDLVALLAAIFISAVDVNGPVPTAQYLNAVPVLLIGYCVGVNYKFSANLFNAPLISKIGGLTFGVYLAHPIAILVLRHIGVNGAAFPILAFTLTMLGVYIAKETLPKSITSRII